MLRRAGVPAASCVRRPRALPEQRADLPSRLRRSRSQTKRSSLPRARSVSRSTPTPRSEASLFAAGLPGRAGLDSDDRQAVVADPRPRLRLAVPLDDVFQPPHIVLRIEDDEAVQLAGLLINRPVTLDEAGKASDHWHYPGLEFVLLLGLERFCGSPDSDQCVHRASS